VSTTISIPGSGNVNVNVFGRGTVIAGSGNDRINIHGVGTIIVGSGNDTLTLGHGGFINQYGLSGHDTINVGSTGNSIISEQGSATDTGAFGQATISHETLEIFQSGGQERVVVLPYGELSPPGGSSGSGHTTSSGSSGSTHTQGGSGTGHTTVVGSSGHTTVAGSSSSGHKSFDFLKQEKGGSHVVHNFVSGQSHLVVEGHSLNYMLAKNEINMHADQTMIHMDGGKTTIELHLSSAEIAGKLGH